MKKSKCLLLSTLCFVVSVVGSAPAAYVFTHSGSNDPASEGWTVLGPGSNVTAGPVTNDLGTGLNAWNVNDPTTGGGSTLQYQMFPTNSQATQALNFGWQMDIRLRVVNTPDAPDASISVEYFDGLARFGLEIGSTANGDPTVDFFLTNSSFTFTGGGSGYHLYSVRYNPGTSTAALYIDGIQRLTNVAGSATGAAPEIAWGARGSATAGNGNYNLVQLTIVPEPSTWAFSLAGVVPLVALRGWRKKHPSAVRAGA